MKDNRQFVETELKIKKNKIYLITFPHEEEIFIDTRALPKSALLCAMCDGISCFCANVGPQKRKQERCFIPIDWAINDWGGPKELVDAMKKRRQIMMDDMEHMRTLVEKIDTPPPYVKNRREQ